MRTWVHLIVFLAFGLALGAQAETPSPVPEPGSVQAAPRPFERLFQSLGKLSTFVTGEPAPSPDPAAPSPAPVADAAPTPDPSKPNPNPLTSILSLKPETPVSTAVAGGGAAQAGVPPVKVEFDDSQKKKRTVEAGQYDRNSEGGAPGHKGPASKVTGARGKPVAFDKWYPVCLFFDAVGNANQITKDLTDMAAKCGVNLITYPVFVTGVSAAVGALKAAAKSKCNATDGFGRFGVNRGSVVLVTGNTNLPRQLCNAPGASAADIPHCGEMGGMWVSLLRVG